MSAVSVVIPTLDEGAWIGDCLAQFAGQAGDWELIVVDGGSGDETAGIARAAGAQVVEVPAGRGPQLNAGAAAATSDTLLFLHADARLPADAQALIHQTLTQPATAAGCFRTRHRPSPTRGPLFGGLVGLADLRSRWTRLPYGDQGLFLAARTFRQVGGYPDQPLMEDLELARRLRSHGRIATTPATIEVSARAFERGLLRHGLTLNTFPTLYRLGVSPETLARWYRRGVSTPAGV